MQIDKKIKWANCCNKEIVCIHCSNFESCKKWLAYVDKHCNRKGYAHFDARTSLADDKTRERVLDAQWVARHGFWPLIHTPLKWDKYVKSDGSQKPTKKNKVRDVRLIGAFSSGMLSLSMNFMTRRFLGLMLTNAQ